MLSQVEVDGGAQQELATLKTLLEQAKRQGREGRSEPGLNDTRLWQVLAGNGLVDINDVRVQLSEFVLKDVTMQTGDTIIWESRFFHGPFPGPGSTFALTFETTELFKYFCGIHRDQGMEGTIIVQPRQAQRQWEKVRHPSNGTVELV